MQRTFAISITKEQLAGLPLTTHQGSIVVIETPLEAQKALEEIAHHDVVGFDTETRPAFRKGKLNSVALIQVSTGEKTYLFRINKMGLLPELLRFFESTKTLKIGLSTKDDFFMLHKIHNFEPKGCIELQSMVKEYGITDCSLQKIYGILYGERISKGQRLSNWEAAELSEAQCKYAAIDAYACLRIYRTLASGEFTPETSPYVHDIETESNG